jgi:hypothetical protein
MHGGCARATQVVNADAQNQLRPGARFVKTDITNLGEVLTVTAGELPLLVLQVVVRVWVEMACRSYRQGSSHPTAAGQHTKSPEISQGAQGHGGSCIWLRSRVRVVYLTRWACARHQCAVRARVGSVGVLTGASDHAGSVAGEHDIDVECTGGESQRPRAAPRNPWQGQVYL